MTIRSIWLGRALGWLGGAALWLGAGCGGSDGNLGPQLQAGGFELLRIDWSEALPSASGTGRVATLAESGDQVAVYSELGIFLWASGSTAGTDVSIRAWRSAAAVPALGLPGEWLVGIDDQGHIHRLRNGATFGLEDVSARYALADKPVREVVALGKRDGSAASSAVFGVGEQLALSDGVTQKFFDLPLKNLVAGYGRVAATDGSTVRLWDPQAGALRRMELANNAQVVGAAFSPDGLLWVATPDTLYVERDSALAVAHRFPPEQTVTALVGAARGLWLGLREGESAQITLAQVRDYQLLIPTNPPALPAETRLVGSKSTDVWTIGSDGNLARYGQESGTGRDLAIYREKLVPIFGKYCQSCHLPSGSAHIDMTTYSSWTRLRAQVMTRVVARTPTPMPPTGAGTLTEAELADVKAWAERNP
ncbi:MAG TPA: cytochrome c [Pseudomonadota bacterium]|nr:cytochrome c [Pseudomonadota bacterium]